MLDACGCLCLSLAPLVLCFAAAVAPTPLNMTPPLTLSSPPTQPQVFRYRPCTLLVLVIAAHPPPPPTTTTTHSTALGPSRFDSSHHFQVLRAGHILKSLQRRHWSHQRLDYPVFVSLVQYCPSGFKIPPQLQIQTPGPQFYQVRLFRSNFIFADSVSSDYYTRVQERSFESSRLRVQSLWLVPSAPRNTFKLCFKSTPGGWIVMRTWAGLTALTLGLDGQAESGSAPSLKFKTGVR
ncbi:hypothetical protein C8R43DRAFT_1053805, partial [Mycena crocata]